MKNKKILIYIILLVILIILFFISIGFGSTKMSFTEFFNALFDKNDINHLIIIKIRLPRVIAAIVSGMALAVSGLILQRVLNQDLASPNTIGVNSASGFFAIISFLLFSYNTFISSIFAFFGAILATILVILIGSKSIVGRRNLILAGIAISTLFSALSKAIFVLYPNLLLDSNSFLIGTLSNITFKDFMYQIPVIFICLFITILLSKRLDLLYIGEADAKVLGLNVKKYQIIFIILASLLAASVVSYAGLISFVGLITPHICKRFFKFNSIDLILSSILLGGIIVLFCDLIVRIFFYNYDMPVGVILSIIGVPFFIYMLLTRRGHRA